MNPPRPFPSWCGRLARLGGACALVVLLSLPSLHAQRRARYRDLEMITPEWANWELPAGFKHDVFTFARLQFATDGGWGRGWDDDSPDAELNLTLRLHEVTSLQVAPGLHVIDITPKELADHPFVYMAGAGQMVLRGEEVTILRNYLLNGGFLMAEDFWGDDQWEHFYQQIRRVFPNREPVELSLDHPIFHAVFTFSDRPQMPSAGVYRSYHTLWEPRWPYVKKDHTARYYALFDDKNRMMALICHNNHFGDGWEHEGDDGSYFQHVSEPSAYPMMINIVFYAMTH
jgi:uncharacterized protein DUF4159